MKKVRISKQHLGKRGYLTMGINQKLLTIHRIIANVFIPNPENKPCINHINGIKTDNRVENLEWCTYSENILHAYKEILHIPYRKAVMQFTKSGEFIREWEAVRFAAECLDIDVGSVIKCCKLQKNYKTCGGFKWEYSNKP